jgi:hypothetical protein
VCGIANGKATNLDVNYEQLGDIGMVGVDVDPVLGQVHF